MTDIIDMSENIDAEDMPLCPLCDQPIFEYEPYQDSVYQMNLDLVGE